MALHCTVTALRCERHGLSTTARTHSPRLDGADEVRRCEREHFPLARQRFGLYGTRQRDLRSGMYTHTPQRHLRHRPAQQSVARARGATACTAQLSEWLGATRKGKALRCGLAYRPMRMNRLLMTKSTLRLGLYAVTGGHTNGLSVAVLAA